MAGTTGEIVLYLKNLAWSLLTAAKLAAPAEESLGSAKSHAPKRMSICNHTRRMEEIFMNFMLVPCMIPSLRFSASW